MPLQPLTSTRDWAAEIVEALRPRLTAKISVHSPGDASGQYDPNTDVDTGASTGTPLITSRASRGRRVKTREVVAGDQWRTPGVWRWTIISEPGDPEIVEGSRLTVLDPGLATELSGKTMTVTEASRSTEAPILFIDAKVD